VGLIGAAFSVALWFHYYQPATTILGSYSAQIHDGVLGEQMSTLAAVLGLMAVIAGIGGGLGVEAARRPWRRSSWDRRVVLPGAHLAQRRAGFVPNPV